MDAMSCVFAMDLGSAISSQVMSRSVDDRVCPDFRHEYGSRRCIIVG